MTSDPFPEAELDAAEQDGSEVFDEGPVPGDSSATDEPRGTSKTTG